MPIEHSIDPERRLVMARCHGEMTEAEVFGYQTDVWSRSEVAGFHELIDMTDVEKISDATPERVRDLANVSALMDVSSPSRVAIVAPTPLAFGLGRMYQAYREMNEKSTKSVGVFRTMAEAWAYLELPGPPPKCEE